MSAASRKAPAKTYNKTHKTRTITAAALLTAIAVVLAPVML